MQSTFPKKFDIFILALIYLVALSVNVTKAVHIDDTAYLQMAQAIHADPLHPLSQTINIRGIEEPVYTINQPLLLSYVLAVIMFLGMDSDIAYHLAWSIFSLAAIISFYMLALLLKLNALFLTGLFALSPAFLPGQNLMFDIPLIALWLTFFWAMFSAQGNKTNQRYFLAAGLLGIAVLAKYTSVVLFCIFIIIIVYRRHWKALWFLIIPLGTLMLWSIFNYFDYGSIHILDRRIYGQKSIIVFLNNFIAFTAGLGLISPFIFILMLQKKPTPITIILLACAGLMGVGVWGVAIYDKTPNPTAIIWAIYCFAGALALFFIPYCIYTNVFISNIDEKKQYADRNLILILWIVGTASFLILFSPDIAIRHIQLILPPTLFLLGNYLQKEKVGILNRAIVITLTFLLGITIAMSDAWYANIPREYVTTTKTMLPADARIWLFGRWGWNWYSKKQGIFLYNANSPNLQLGDYLILPESSIRYKSAIKNLANTETVKNIKTFQIPAPPFAWIRTMYYANDVDQYGGYYAFEFPGTLPAAYTQEPFVFSIKQIVTK